MTDLMELADVRLEIESGLPMCWIVWALKPGDANPLVVAICTNEAKARTYETECAGLFPEHRLAAEKAPMDHTFGAADLRSVAMRSARRRFPR